MIRIIAVVSFYHYLIFVGSVNTLHSVFITDGMDEGSVVGCNEGIDVGSN